MFCIFARALGKGKNLDGANQKVAKPETGKGKKRKEAVGLGARERPSRPSVPSLGGTP